MLTEANSREAEWWQAKQTVSLRSLIVGKLARDFTISDSIESQANKLQSVTSEKIHSFGKIE